MSYWTCFNCYFICSKSAIWFQDFYERTQHFFSSSYHIMNDIYFDSNEIWMHFKLPNIVEKVLSVLPITKILKHLCECQFLKKPQSQLLLLLILILWNWYLWQQIRYTSVDKEKSSNKRNKTHLNCCPQLNSHKFKLCVCIISSIYDPLNVHSHTEFQLQTMYCLIFKNSDREKFFFASVQFFFSFFSLFL